MFLLQPPSDARIRQILDSQSHTEFSYPEPGCTRNSTVQGHRVDCTRFELGRGAEVFRLARQAVSEWRMFDAGWIRLCWPSAPIRPATTVAVLARHLGFWSLNVCRIIYVIDEDRRYGFAYGTLPEHAESGEERFTVEWRKDDSVWYHVVACARERHPLARIAFPLARALQSRFRRDSGRAMQRALHARP